LTEHTQLSTDGLSLPWSWCARCQRAYLTGTYRLVQFAGTTAHPRPPALKLCPYPGCSGSPARDGWRWATIRARFPEFPERPELDIVYSAAA